MKIANKIAFALLFCSPFLQSCLFQEEDIFDKPASQRLDEAAAILRETLQSSEDGWKLTYYTDPEQYGAYNFLFKFENGEVVAQGDSLFPQGKFTSKWEINKSQGGIVLDFSSYNDVFTDIADPGKYIAGQGLSGDIEFIWKRYSADKDTIYLQAKKNGAKIQLIKFHGNWDTYIDNINDVMDKFANGAMNRYFKVIDFADGTSLVLGAYHKITRRFDQIFINDNDSLKVIENGLAFHENGIEFYEPVTVKGKTITGLTYDRGTGTFSVENGTVTAGIPPFVMPGDFTQLFQREDSYYFTHLSQSLMQEYYRIDSLMTTAKSLPNINMKNIEFGDMSLVMTSGSNATLIVYYRCEIDGETRWGQAASTPIIVRKNINGRADAFRFSNNGASAVTGDYATLLKPSMDKFRNAITQSGRDYIAVPDEYFEYIRFGSQFDGTFFGIKKE
ncbi:hypothetical protein FACS189413_02100 [Bacteroidia bacterium]|nr:hypothetical protein FACS189413_02100 [Bacteroidia bacterium]